MRLTLRLTWLLIVALAAICCAVTWYQAKIQFRALQRDIERRSQISAEALRTVVEPLMRQDAGESAIIQELINRFASGDNGRAVFVYDRMGHALAAAGSGPVELKTAPSWVTSALQRNTSQGAMERMGAGTFHMLVVPLHDRQGGTIGGLLVAYDTAVFRGRKLRIWRTALLMLLAEIAGIVVVVGLVVRRTIIRPITRTTRWLRAVRTGNSWQEPAAKKDELWKPFADEVDQFAKSLSNARASAEREASLRHAGDSLWTRERLSASVRAALNDSRLVVVSNREPYMHRWNRNEIEAIVPASGLVTALEPILNACNGTWVAHGSGDADRRMVDKNDCLRVPPQHPQYTLRRVWLEKEVEEGYYYGFANEGLWPLCHIAHTRPVFRSRDWQHYQQVNLRFADAVVQEIRSVQQPIVFVQDYHFALLPRLLKQRRPDARVAVFWHIPWPNPEAFGICPWQGELLDGLLGADLLGFHIQTHCHNFMHTVDRALECRIDWTSMTAVRNRHQTRVRPFPISVDYEQLSAREDDSVRSYLSRQPQVLERLGTEALFLGVGVDRVDYTKGIPERFRGIERFLEKYPIYREKFSFVQIAAPSRTHIQRYDDLLQQVEREAERINLRFGTKRWQPIVFLKGHHTHAQIYPFYQAADVCLVTSLHDGMNLVAKEFLASRSDSDGMLVLSRFAGAAEELPDALLVNPYDTDDIVEALRAALEMLPEERRLRMRRMRKRVEEHNVFRWAGMLIEELTGLRAEPGHDNVESKSQSAGVA